MKDPELTWLREDPPQDQLDAHDKMRGKPKGAWGKYLAYCQANVGVFFRSHPIMRRHTAQQAASDTKSWCLVSGQEKLEFGTEDGWWETYWGHGPDKNMLENYYIWTRWVTADWLNTLTVAQVREEIKRYRRRLPPKATKAELIEIAKVVGMRKVRQTKPDPRPKRKKAT